MKKSTTVIVMLFLMNIGCTKETIEPIVPCQLSTENYLTGKIINKTECWQEDAQYQFGSAGPGAYGQGYENNPYQFMAIGLNVIEKQESKHKRDLTIYIPFPGEAFSTQEKFYNLLQVKKYGYLQQREDYGQFIIEYKDVTGEYSTLTTNQAGNTIEILEIEKIPSKGPGTGLGQALRLKMKINCELADKQGKLYGKLEEVEISGITYRPEPWGETWPDQYQ